MFIFQHMSEIAHFSSVNICKKKTIINLSISALVSELQSIKRFTPLQQRQLIMNVQCQCGAVEFSTSLPTPLDVYCCHCIECQKQSSSAFGTSAIFPTDGMWPLADEIMSRLNLWKRPTAAGNTLECYFCKVCGVRVIHRCILKNGTAKATLSVKGGCVDGLSWEGAKHIWTRTARIPVPEGSDPKSPKG